MKTGQEVDIDVEVLSHLEYLNELYNKVKEPSKLKLFDFARKYNVKGNVSKVLKENNVITSKIVGKGSTRTSVVEWISEAKPNLEMARKLYKLSKKDSVATQRKSRKKKEQELIREAQESAQEKAQDNKNDTIEAFDLTLVKHLDKNNLLEHIQTILKHHGSGNHVLPLILLNVLKTVKEEGYNEGRQEALDMVQKLRG